MLKLISLVLLALVSTAQAQSPVRQSGNVTPRHFACWTTTGVIQDCGTAAIPFPSSLGTWGSGPTQCAYSDNPASAAGYQQLCFGATTSGGGQISVQNFGTASALPLILNINGTPVSIPASSGAGTFVTTSTPTTNSAVSCFNGTTGAIGSCSTLASALVAGDGLSYSGVNLTFNIGALPLDTSLDATNDMLLLRRASDGAYVKTNPTTIAGTNTAGVGSIGGLAGTVGISTGLTTSGNSILVNTATIPGLSTNNTYTGTNTFAVGKVTNIAGIVCDGTTDNYTVVNTAATTAAANGSDLIFPPGACVIDMTGKSTITIRGGLIGQATSFNYPSSGTAYTGTNLLIKGTTATPFSLTTRSVVRNINFVYPNQTVPSAPTAYPATLSIANSENVLIDNVTMVNAYVGISITGTSGFIQVLNSRFSSFNESISIATTLAENTFIGNDFSYSWGYDFYNNLGVLSDWQAAYAASATGIRYTGTNADAQVIKGNTFVGAQNGILVSHLGADCYFWGNITGNGFDGNFRSISFAGTCRPNIVAITGNVFSYLATATGSIHIVVSPAGTTANYSVSITGNTFSCSKANHLYITAASTQPGSVTVSGNTFECMGYAQSTGGPFYSAIISGDTIRATYTGNTINGFGNTETRGVLGQSFDTLVLTGNTIIGTPIGFEITAGNACVIVGNASSSVATQVTGTATVQKEANNSWN